MSARTKHQILKGPDGSPAFAVIPYDEYLELLGIEEPKDEEEFLIPDDVAGFCLEHGFSIIRAWREYLGLTQKEAAEKIGVTPSAFSQMEHPDGNPRIATLKKIAEAFGIHISQLKL